MHDERKVTRRILTDGTKGSESLIRRMMDATQDLPSGESLQEYAGRRNEIAASHVTVMSNVLSKFDAFDIIELMRQRETPISLAGYRESESDGLGAAVELVALILLARGSREAPIRDESITPNLVIEQLHRRATKVLQVGAFSLLAEGESNKYGPLSRLAAHYRSSELFIRNKQYIDIHDEINREIFGSELSGNLAEIALGFTFEEFLKARESIESNYVDRISDHLDALGEVASDWAANGYREQDGTQIERGREAVRDVFIYPGIRSSFTAGEIAQLARIPVSRVEKVLDCFSVAFSQGDPVSTVQRFLDGDRPFSRASIISDGAGNYIGLGTPIGTDCFRHAVEEALKGRSSWSRYDRQRTRASEGLAIRYLEKLLGTKCAHAQLKYYAPRDGVPVTALNHEAAGITSLGNESEADALFLIEDVAICVEVKGRSISEGAKHGHVKKLATDIEKTIGDATYQARRLEQLIEQNGGLWLANREWLNLDHVREIRSIAVCLDDMGPLAIALDELVRANVINADRFPWVVSLHDLAVLAAVLERPAEFLLYLRRRTESDVSKHFTAVDELDLFMLFLNGGLYLDPDPDKVFEDFPSTAKPSAKERKRYREQSVPTRVHTHTDRLDAWMYFKEGSSIEEAEKPTFSITEKVREIVDFLQDGKKPGWFRFAADLLNLSSEAQRRLAECMEYVVDSTRKDHAPHSALQGYAGAWGFPSLFVYSRPNGMSVAEAQGRMSVYLTAKKHQLLSDRALGILLDEQGGIAALQYDNSPPGENPELDELVASMGLVPPERMAKAVPPSARRDTRRLRGSRQKKKRR
ncbi:hypothetical protein ACH5AI_02550 [Streptomyces collinus]|uniref:hypothetical protein n=1 Tax=Streptomyces collinus TaxID=42684 RepID=UPI0037BC1ABC